MDNVETPREGLFQALEGYYDCNLLAYYCSDHPLIAASLDDDALRPMQEHLLGLTQDGRRQLQRLAVLLHTSGGKTETPWKMVTLIRQFCREFWVIVPEKAYSAGTLFALGADKILMGPCGLLGPIDPTLNRVPPSQPHLSPDKVAVEDVAAYIRFLKNRAGMTDQDVIGNLMAALANHLGPLVLGTVERTYSHIRLVAKKMLALHKTPMDHQVRIVEALTEQAYSHGHGIGRQEAREIGLEVEDPPAEQAQVARALIRSYERETMDIPRDVQSAISQGEGGKYEAVLRVATMESTAALHQFTALCRIRPVWQVAHGVTIQPVINIKLPPEIKPVSIPDEVQARVSRILQDLSGQAQRILYDELQKVMPVTTFEGQFLNCEWKRLR